MRQITITYKGGFIMDTYCMICGAVLDQEDYRDGKIRTYPCSNCGTDDFMSADEAIAAIKKIWYPKSNVRLARWYHFLWFLNLQIKLFGRVII
jgi:hypothetical protein